MNVFTFMLPTLGWHYLATTLANTVLLGFNRIVVKGVVLSGELLLLDHQLGIDFANAWCFTLMRALVRLVTHATIPAVAFCVEVILLRAHEGTIGKCALVGAHNDVALAPVVHQVVRQHTRMLTSAESTRFSTMVPLGSTQVLLF